MTSKIGMNFLITVWVDDEGVGFSSKNITVTLCQWVWMTAGMLDIDSVFPQNIHSFFIRAEGQDVRGIDGNVKGIFHFFHQVHVTH